MEATLQEKEEAEVLTFRQRTMIVAKWPFRKLVKIGNTIRNNWFLRGLFTLAAAVASSSAGVSMGILFHYFNDRYPLNAYLFGAVIALIAFWICRLGLQPTRSSKQQKQK